MEEIQQKKDLHIFWVRQHPLFCDRDSGRKGEEYVELLEEMYKGLENVFIKYGFVSRLVDDFLKDDILRYNKVDKVSQRLAEIEKSTLSNVEISDDLLWAFITIGFNEQTITPQKMSNVSKKVSELKYFKDCYYVFEKHRENGIHHHTHFLVKFYKKEFKSKIIDWIYQVRGMREVCLKKEFIDILGPLNSKKIYQPYEKYYEYINGNKKQDKLKYVEQDKQWRNENNMSHILYRSNIDV